jgi:hypothetical protein
MNFVYIDMKDGTGGFIIPDDGEGEDVIEELLKDPKYVRREPGKETP